MGTEQDKYDIEDTIGFIGSALEGMAFIRANIIGAKRLCRLSNSERAMIDDILIKLQEAAVDLTAIKRAKERSLKELCK